MCQCVGYKNGPNESRECNDDSSSDMEEGLGSDMEED